MTEPMIAVKSLNFHYQETASNLFSNFDLEIENGRVVVLLGPNGAGKTTLLRLLLNLVSPQSGTIKILGSSAGDSQLQARIAFLSEQPTRYEFLNLREFLQYFANLHNSDSTVNNQQAKALIANIDPELPMKNYSKGMMQRLNFARLLLHDPELVFLDEPSTGLDPIGHLKIQEMVHELKHLGKSVFLNTHNLDFAMNVADEIIVMNRGQIVLQSLRTEITKEQLESVFLGLESERS